MKFAFKSMVAATVFVATGVASATNIVFPSSGGTYPVAGPPLVETLSFSGDFLGMLDTAKIAIASYGPGYPTAMKDRMLTTRRSPLSPPSRRCALTRPGALQSRQRPPAASP